MAETVSTKPWSSFSDSDYSIEQLKRATLIDLNPPGKTPVKGLYKLRVREPSGVLNRNGVFAAAQRLISGTDAPAADKRAAARKLITLYGTLNAPVPDAIRRMAM